MAAAAAEEAPCRIRCLVRVRVRVRVKVRVRVRVRVRESRWGGEEMERGGGGGAGVSAAAMQDENAMHVVMTPMRQGVTPGKTMMHMQSGTVGVGTTAGKTVLATTTTTQKRRALGNISNTVLRSAGKGGAQVPLGRTAMKAERARTERSGSRLAKAAVAQPTSRAAAYADTPVERPCGLMRDELQREMDARHERDMRRRVARMTSRTAGMVSSSAHVIITSDDAENDNDDNDDDGDEAMRQYHLLCARDAGNDEGPDDLQDLADALVTAGADTLP